MRAASAQAPTAAAPMRKRRKAAQRGGNATSAYLTAIGFPPQRVFTARAARMAPQESAPVIVPRPAAGDGPRSAR